MLPAMQKEPVHNEALRDHDAPLRIVIVGHVDHGKSTLVGRLLHDTGSLPEGKLEAVEASCARRGMPFEWAFLLDALQAERDQNVTIDMTQIWFKSAKRRYQMIDAPGHSEFLKNMITGAAEAEAALLVIDAAEGLSEQSRRHAQLLQWLGVNQVAVVINKMDLVAYSEPRYQTLVQEYSEFLQRLGLEAQGFIPVSARSGEGIVTTAEQMPWYPGPHLLAMLDQFEPAAAPQHQPLRFSVQDIYRFDQRRIIAGRIESGQLAVGDAIAFAPSGLKGRVKALAQWPVAAADKHLAITGESIGVILEDQIFVERGQIGHPHDHPPLTANMCKVRLFWLHDEPLRPGLRYRLKLGHQELPAEVKRIEGVVDGESLALLPSEEVCLHQMAEVVLQMRGNLAFDIGQLQTGRFVLFDHYQMAGGGRIIAEADAPATRLAKATNIQSEDFEITAQERAVLNGHKGGVLWFTGLSGSGKSTLAREMQKRLFAKGWQVYVLDGDNIRQGLCSDLGFSAQDRAENIRRIGEVASLFADAGVLVITAFISPSNEDRRRARAAARDYFNTIYIKADLATCEARDVKGLYKKARAGQIVEFTGISAPYDEPENPDLTVNTATLSIDQSIELLMNYISENFSNS